SRRALSCSFSFRSFALPRSHSRLRQKATGSAGARHGHCGNYLGALPSLPVDSLNLKGAPMIPATTDRVIACTDSETNKAIERSTYLNVRNFAQASPQTIDRRLCELDHEWDTDRLIGVIEPSLTLLGLALGIWVHPAWLALSALSAASLLVYSLS